MLELSRPYVGFIICPSSLVDHIGQRGLDFDDVRDVAQHPARPEFRWLNDPLDARGPRLLATGYTDSGREIRVVLYPVNPAEGTYRLGTAHDA